jgi:hypothetical protein
VILSSNPPLKSAVYGDGSDGDAVLAVNTALTRDMFYDNLTINPGIMLSTANWRLFVSDTLTGEATAVISNDGGAATGLVAGVSPTPGGTLGIGKDGGTGGVGAGAAGGSNTPGVGGTGGAGGLGAGGAGGPAGTITAPRGGIKIVDNLGISLTWLAVDGAGTLALLLAGAGGGAGGGSGGGQQGGGGGAGAGNILVAARRWNFIGTVTAKGGNGGNGVAGNAGGGGGGGGGCIVRVYQTELRTPTVNVVGGTKGIKFGAGTGVNGNDGAPGQSVVLEV